MKIAVIGAGIVGITTAYELANDGHQVTLLEKASSAAVASSFAPSGVISPALMQHLSHPIWKQKRWFSGFGGTSQFSMDCQTTWTDIRWLRRWNSRRSADRALQDAFCAHSLIELSQRQLRATAGTAKIEYERAEGLLMLAHTSADLKTMQIKAEILKDWGVAIRAVTAEEISKIEPGLQTSNVLLGAFYLPGDEVGNCRQFALHLKNELQSMGVQVHFETPVSAIHCNPHARVFIENQTTPLEFDHVVMCSGVDTRPLLHGLKIKLPMATISSYSLTTRVKEDLIAPRSVVYNASDRTTITRLGNRIRVAYGAELGIPSKKHAKKSVQHLFRTLQQNFPGAAEYSNGVQVWKGAFGVMSDGLPVIGQSALPNLWLNVGHGPNGWAMASGAGRCIADAIKDRQPPIDIAAYSPLRF